MDKIKQARIVGIPRQGVLKPAHAATRLRDQHFELGDRVITVAETGSVPLSAKGVVVGVQSQFVDVVFDVQFMGGTTLGGRSVVFPSSRTTSDRLLISLLVQMLQLPRRYRLALGGPQLVEPPVRNGCWRSAAADSPGQQDLVARAEQERQVPPWSSRWSCDPSGARPARRWLPPFAAERSRPWRHVSTCFRRTALFLF
mgnify:CR=1 FL=1|jgi:hypothetical protein